MKANRNDFIINVSYLITLFSLFGLFSMFSLFSLFSLFKDAVQAHSHFMYNVLL